MISLMVNLIYCNASNKTPYLLCGYVRSTELAYHYNVYNLAKEMKSN